MLPAYYSMEEADSVKVSESKQFVFDCILDERVNWAQIYSSFNPQFAAGDCSELCKHQMDGDVSVDAGLWRMSQKLAGCATGVCCHGKEYFGSKQLLLMGKSEADYLAQHISEEFIVRAYDEDAYNFLCLPCKCYREMRPFQCRSFPFFPLVDLKGEVTAIVHWDYDKTADTYCPLRWENVATVQQEQFVFTWEKILRDAEMRKIYLDYFLAEEQ